MAGSRWTATPTRPGSATANHDVRLERTGAIAQLGERLLCKQEVTGSNPVGSTREVPANSHFSRVVAVASIAVAGLDGSVMEASGPKWASKGTEDRVGR